MSTTTLEHCEAQTEAQADTQDAITAALAKASTAKQRSTEALRRADAALDKACLVERDAHEVRGLVNDLSGGVAKLRLMSDERDQNIETQLSEVAAACGDVTNRAQAAEIELAHLKQASTTHDKAVAELCGMTTEIAATVADPLKLLAPEVLKAMQHVRDIETTMIGATNDLMIATRRRQAAAQDLMVLKLERAKFTKHFADERARVESMAPQDGKNEAIRKQQMSAYVLTDPELQALTIEGDLLDERLVAAEYDLQCANDDIAMFRLIVEGSRTQIESHSAMMQVFVTAASLGI